jgi:hypothetical protein
MAWNGGYLCAYQHVRKVMDYDVLRPRAGTYREEDHAETLFLG